MSAAVDFETRVCRMPPGTGSSAVAGPRVALGSRGQIICTFVAQTAAVPLTDGSVLVVLWTAPETSGEIVAVKLAGVS